MKIKGTHVLGVDRSDLWPMLQDPEVLARISPGVSRIESLGDDRFTAISDISIGPVRGSFEGDLAIVDKNELEEMTLVLTQKSKIGNAEAKITMQLADAEDNATEVSYAGTAKVSGTLATMGQRILGGVIKTLTKQVFSELETIIEERSTPNAGPEEQNAEPSSEVRDKKAKTQLEGLETQLDDKSKGILESIIDKIKSVWKSLLG